jgi:uncharacterized RDD family membrane protein YckC
MIMNLEISKDYMDSGANTLPEADFSFPPLAGFWRRILAFIIDVVILAVVGQIIGWSLSDFWFNSGPNGRIAGFLIIFIYFGLTYSKIFNGQSIGKRIVKIAVRDKDNNPINLGRALLRASILTIPFILNGWTLPSLENTIINVLILVVVFGIGASIVYTMIFNRSSRQGIHDLISSTYVVSLSGKPIEKFPQSSKKHWVISGVLIAIAILIGSLSTSVTGLLTSKMGITDLVETRKILQADNRVFSIGIQGNTRSSFGSINNQSFKNSSRSIYVTAWLKGRPSDQERSLIMNDIVKILIQNVDINQYDTIGISLKSGFDLGIASSWRTYSESHTIQEWVNKVQ